jgi:hypothetical protein
LKNGVDPNQKSWLQNQVKMVVEVKNNTEVGQDLESWKAKIPNKVLRLKFNELKATTSVTNFAVVVFSETLLRPKVRISGDFKKIRLENKTVNSLL